jgi:hypothetical protein
MSGDYRQTLTALAQGAFGPGQPARPVRVTGFDGPPPDEIVEMTAPPAPSGTTNVQAGRKAPLPLVTAAEAAPVPEERGEAAASLSARLQTQAREDAPQGREVEHTGLPRPEDSGAAPQLFSSYEAALEGQITPPVLPEGVTDLPTPEMATPERRADPDPDAGSAPLDEAIREVTPPMAEPRQMDNAPDPSDLPPWPAVEPQPAPPAAPAGPAVEIGTLVITVTPPAEPQTPVAMAPSGQPVRRGTPISAAAQLRRAGVRRL